MTTRPGDVYLVLTDRRPQDVQLAVSTSVATGSSAVAWRIPYYPPHRTGEGTAYADAHTTGHGLRLIVGEGAITGHGATRGEGQRDTVERAEHRRRLRTEADALTLYTAASGDERDLWLVLYLDAVDRAAEAGRDAA